MSFVYFKTGGKKEEYTRLITPWCGFLLLLRFSLFERERKEEETRRPPSSHSHRPKKGLDIH